MTERIGAPLPIPSTEFDQNEAIVINRQIEQNLQDAYSDSEKDRTYESSVASLAMRRYHFLAAAMADTGGETGPITAEDVGAGTFPGNFTFSGTVTISSNWLSIEPSSGDAYLRFAGASGNEWRMISRVAGQLDWRDNTGGNNVMTLTAAGVLDVPLSITSGNFKADDPTAELQLNSSGANNHARLTAAPTGAGGNLIINTSNNGILLQTGGTTALTLDSAQNATFAGTLDARDDITLSISDTQVIARLDNTGNDGSLQLYTGEVTPVLRTVITSSASDSYISNGFFGIGNTNPTVPLDVTGAANISGTLDVGAEVNVVDGYVRIIDAEVSSGELRLGAVNGLPGFYTTGLMAMRGDTGLVFSGRSQTISASVFDLKVDTSGNFFINGASQHEGDVGMTTHLIVGSAFNHADAAFMSTGDINMRGGVLATIFSSATNIDHIWHDDAANNWHLVSDTTYKATGNSGLVCGLANFNGGGQAINLDGPTSNRIRWSTAGVAAPTFTSYSAGVKLVIYDSIGGSSTGYAIGIESSTMWFGTDQNAASQRFKWYMGTSERMTMENDVLRPASSGLMDLGLTGTRWAAGWFSGTVTAPTFSGALSGNATTATTAGTVTTAAQPNITSLGTLNNLVVDSITINGTSISGVGTITATTFSGALSGNATTATTATTANSVTAANVTAGTFGSGTFTFAGQVRLNGNILYLDNGSNTYIRETPNDVMQFVMGGTVKMNSSASGMEFPVRIGVGAAPGGSNAIFSVINSVSWIHALQNNHTTSPSGLFIKYNADNPDGATNYWIRCDDTTTTRFRVRSDGDCQNHDGTYGIISDVSLKQDITDVDVMALGGSWDDFLDFRFRKWRFITDVQSYGDKAKVLLGGIGQEVALISPGLVSEDENGMLGLKSSILYMKGMVVIQELQKRCLDHEQEIGILASEIDLLKDRLSAIAA